MEYLKLSDCAEYRSSRTKQIDFETYITTDNMLPDRAGITLVESLPDTKTVSKYLPKDILLSNIRPYFKKIWIANREGGCSNDVLVIKAKSNIYPEFLYYVLSDNNFFNYDTVTSKGTKMPRGTPSAIMKYLVPNFDKEQQQKIVSILSNYDNLIEVNNKRIKVLEQMAENLYKEWFVRFRFPGYQTTEFENGIPKGWKYCKLKALLDIRYGKDHKSLDDGIIPVFGSGGIMRFANKALYSKESVMIPRKGTLNNIIYYNGPFWTVDTMFYSVPLIEHFAKYAFYTLASIDMESYNSGAALPSMTTDILYHLKILVPDSKTLKLFDNFISVIFEQKTALQKLTENLIKQRDLLLPRLMSGKLEV
ncbi:restriction endonuclease subunit S [bacterium]|nr:restriction endonuclease subunit S [bacterium]